MVSTNGRAVNLKCKKQQYLRNGITLRCCYHKDATNFKVQSDKAGPVLWEAKGHLHINSWTKETTSSKALKYLKQSYKSYQVSPIYVTTVLSFFKP